jgi:hypothetical protein
MSSPLVITLPQRLVPARHRPAQPAGTARNRPTCPLRNRPTLRQRNRDKVTLIRF